MRKIWIIGLVLAVLGLIIYSITGTQPNPVLDEAYLGKLRASGGRGSRRTKRLSHTAAGSPIAAAQRAAFGGLRYFAARGRATASRRGWRARLVLAAAAAGPQPGVLGRKPTQRWGTAEFELGGQAAAAGATAKARPGRHTPTSCLCPSPTPPMARRPTLPAAFSTCPCHPPKPPKSNSISTKLIIRTAPTTMTLAAPGHPPKTA